MWELACVLVMFLHIEMKVWGSCVQFFWMLSKPVLDCPKQELWLCSLRKKELSSQGSCKVYNLQRWTWYKVCIWLITFLKLLFRSKQVYVKARERTGIKSIRRRKIDIGGLKTCLVFLIYDLDPELDLYTFGWRSVYEPALLSYWYW